MLQALANGGLHAGHVCLACPVPSRQVARVAVVVGFGHVGHVQPIHAANELAPAQHLANEALDAGQWQAACVVSLFGGCDHFARVEQVQVQAAAHQCVPTKRQRGPHGVLPSAKVLQPLVNEMLQRQQRVFACDGPGKVLQRARVFGKAFSNQCDDILRDPVRRKAGSWRHGARAFGAKAFAVFRVIVPLASNGLFPLHQDAVAFAHLAVKELHAQLFFVAGPLGKLGAAAQKVRVSHPAQQDLGLRCGVFDQLLHAPGPGFHHHQGFGGVFSQRLGQATRKVRGQFGVVHLHISKRPAALVRCVGKMPHA